MPSPRVSVVVPTRDRPRRLARLLDALRDQTLKPDGFEVVVCDDGSDGPGTRALLDHARTDAGLDLNVVVHDRPRGPAVARNRAWRASRAPLVAFCDDDCVPTPDWLRALLDARDAVGGDVVVQGPVAPDPNEYPRAFGPFSTTLWVKRAGPRFETANVAYPRELLERLDGFDERLVVAGEDTDLGWRAVEAGARVVWAGDALVHHAVLAQGPWRRLVKGWRWRYVPAVYRRHPGLRRHLIAGVFWSPWHWWLFRAALAVALRPRPPRGPRPAPPASVRSASTGPGGDRDAGDDAVRARGVRTGLGWAYLRWWLAMPYVLRLVDYRTGPVLAPYRLACDLIEVAAIGTGAVRHRVVMI